MKRFLSVFLALFLLIGTVGCAKQDRDAQSLIQSSSSPSSSDTLSEDVSSDTSNNDPNEDSKPSSSNQTSSKPSSSTGGSIGADNSGSDNSSNNSSTTSSGSIESQVIPYEYSINHDESYVTITKYTGTEKNVVIPEKIHNFPVKIIGGGAFMNSNISSVFIPNTITEIFSMAFHNCKNLKNVTLSKNLKTIGALAFKYCSIEEIVLPNGLIAIEERAFEDCDSLVKINIPKTVQIINKPFLSCDKLSSITLQEGLTSIGENAFHCTALTEITIPSTVTQIGKNAFSGCLGLRSVIFLGDAPSIIDGHPFGTLNVTIFYRTDTSGWDTCPLKSYYTLVPTN